jgi:chromosome segregation ATPase
LKKESSRHIRIETDFQTEFEFFNAELASNRHAIGKLAETLSEETSSLRETLSTQLQQFQVESNQRFTDLQNSMERLEFRFKHHIRDCQTITDQVDSHQELMQNLRKQLAQTQLLMDHQKEEQKTFMETIQYTTTKAQEKSSAAFDECSKQLDSFQQQMVGYVKKVEQDSTGTFRPGVISELR